MESVASTQGVTDYPPTTPSLQEGEMVYKIVGEIHRQRTASLYRAYQHYPQTEIMKLVFRNMSPWHAVAVHKITKALYKIDTGLLGYIEGTRAGGGQEGVIENPVLYGYHVRWNGQAGTKEYKNFEDETVLMRLSDIIILDAKGLREHLLSEPPINKR